MALTLYIVGGPTASGKSMYALDLAKQVDGEIVNGDSMQLYHHLHVLTARPTDTQGIPHHLYGVLQGNSIGSLGWWYEAACQVIKDIQARGKTPIVVGGTGLYLRALTQGISSIPKIPGAIRQEARCLAQTLPQEKFFDLVVREDPKVQGVIHHHDTQRLIRALEVVRATNVSIIDYWGKDEKIIDFNYRYYILLPCRDVLYQRINDRFVEIIKNGALEEVAGLLQQNIVPESPILKAVGVPELASYLKGHLSLSQAIEQAQQSTRRYAKRQTTWFTRQAPDAQVID